MTVGEYVRGGHNAPGSHHWCALRKVSCKRNNTYKRLTMNGVSKYFLQKGVTETNLL